MVQGHLNLVGTSTMDLSEMQHPRAPLHPHGAVPPCTFLPALPALQKNDAQGQAATQQLLKPWSPCSTTRARAQQASRALQGCCALCIDVMARGKKNKK